MNNDIGFRIVCSNCGCLSIKIEEPLRASREAMVFCGDCGSPRGTVGALRERAVHRYPTAAFPTSSSALSEGEQTSDQSPAVNEISTQYAELVRLRQQVKVAEWLASEANRPPPMNASARRMRGPSPFVQYPRRKVEYEQKGLADIRAPGGQSASVSLPSEPPSLRHRCPS